jgi:hypothetical protein
MEIFKLNLKRKKDKISKKENIEEDEVDHDDTIIE